MSNSKRRFDRVIFWVPITCVFAILAVAILILLPVPLPARASAMQQPIPVVIPSDNTSVVPVPLFVTSASLGANPQEGIRALFKGVEDLQDPCRAELLSYGTKLVMSPSPWGQGYLEFHGAEEDHWRLHFVVVLTDPAKGTQSTLSLIPTVAEPVLRDPNERRPLGRTQFQRSFVPFWVALHSALSTANSQSAAPKQPPS